MNLANKLTSRKFWVAVAAFLASVGAGLAGVADPTACTACCVLSAAIYAACEAYVDGQSAKANGTSTAITASTTAKEVVDRLTKEQA